MPSFITGFLYILVMVLVLAGAYLTSRWLATKTVKMAQGKYMKLIDRIVLGKDKSVVIILVGQKKYLMSENAQGFHILSELSDEDLPKIEQQPAEQPTFRQIINSYLDISQERRERQPFRSDVLLELKKKMSDALDRIKKHRSEGQSDD